ncbi:Morn repeat protein [Pandoravirus inopinatum]|uniref:Morn repeat protein n=1 Tax=Pandoravirus inopinatum TaxID=1605721 RepID=A0A0B5J9H9_9VIRU|nr:Morn repeat protein [Pandoravirus inopinatum]AJF97531.1 Morn repeat protein [Pandoravirus inopinatum]
MGRRRARKQARVRAKKSPAVCHGDSPFDCLPDELVLAVASCFGSVRALACLGQTCHRMHRLMADPYLWRPLYAVAHGGSEPVGRFAEFGKDWSWVYRARVPIARKKRMKRARSVGTIQRPDVTYRGDFRHAHMHGYGRASWTNGATYDGEWKDDQRHGRGTYVWAIGVCYSGAWEGDQMHGFGAIHYTDGHTFAGMWQRGVFDGVGTHTLSDGRQTQCRRNGTDWYDIGDAAGDVLCVDRPDAHAVIRHNTPGAFRATHCTCASHIF